MEDIFGKIIADILIDFFEYDESHIDFLIEQPYSKEKERVCTIKNMEVRIYPNDHNPPHFHVVSKDYNLNAKFLIETGEYLSGTIKNKDLKRIQVFWLNPKTKIIMEKIWCKYQN